VVPFLVPHLPAKFETSVSVVVLVVAVGSIVVVLVVGVVAKVVVVAVVVVSADGNLRIVRHQTGVDNGCC
jgi:hypothetical protein